MEIFKFLNKKQKSKNIAKERLKMMLLNDRSDVSPQYLDLIRKQLLGSITDYMEYDMNSVEISLQRNTGDDNGAATILVASIPITRVKQYGRHFT